MRDTVFQSFIDFLTLEYLSPNPPIVHPTLTLLISAAPLVLARAIEVVKYEEIRICQLSAMQTAATALDTTAMDTAGAAGA